MSRSELHAPPRDSASRSLARRLTSERTSRRSGWNSRGASPASARRRALVHPSQARRAASSVTTEAHNDSTKNPPSSSRRVVASRRPKKPRSCTSTTTPAAPSSRAALRFTWPDGSSLVVDHQAPPSPSMRSRHTTCWQSNCLGKVAVAATCTPSSVQAAAPMMRSSREMSDRMLVSRAGSSQLCTSPCCAEAMASRDRSARSCWNQARVVSNSTTPPPTESTARPASSNTRKRRERGTRGIVPHCGLEWQGGSRSVTGS